ncbi:MAG TPA: PhaM family polyhydroxyalkanoate granule multifunctional regulatory protein [Usitatibacter sp.]|nr:PhaM family polyhydroxyalkanoate granule multifunctional regulatory protein [Usitatibacter sp.]
MAKPVTPQEMFDLWQKMVNPSAYPLQSFMFPVLDPKELEKKIGELQVVEHWLRANLHLLQLTIKSLEYQKALLKGGERLPQPAPAESGEAQSNPALWAWNMMSELGKKTADVAEKATKPAKSAPAKKKKPAK